MLRAALLPIFGMSEISVISGLQSLWVSEPALGLLVTGLAIFAPFALAQEAATEDRTQRAWQAALDRHDVLRTGFLKRPEQPLQWVARHVALPMAELDWQGHPTQHDALGELAQASPERRVQRVDGAAQHAGDIVGAVVVGLSPAASSVWPFGVVMVPACNAQDPPQHGGGNCQPAGNQHHDGHCQAHQCLLFALHRAHTFSIRSVSVTV